MEQGRGVEVDGSGHRNGGGGGRACGVAIDRRTRCKKGRAVGIGSGTGRTGTGAGNRAEVSSCGRGVSFRSSDQQWWRTELDLSSGKAFDDRHRSATVGATPKRLRFLSGGSFWLGLG